MGDVVQIEQVLFRILQNAVKYTEAPGKVKFAVETDDEKNGRKRDFVRFLIQTEIIHLPLEKKGFYILILL